MHRRSQMESLQKATPMSQKRYVSALQMSRKGLTHSWRMLHHLCRSGRLRKARSLHLAKSANSWKRKWASSHPCWRNLLPEASRWELHGIVFGDIWAQCWHAYSRCVWPATRRHVWETQQTDVGLAHIRQVMTTEQKDAMCEHICYPRSRIFVTCFAKNAFIFMKNTLFTPAARFLTHLYTKIHSYVRKNLFFYPPQTDFDTFSQKNTFMF